MKKIITLSLIAILSIGLTNAAKPKPCGTFQGHNLYKGEKGGCFYLKTKKKLKVYVDKKHCNCK
ncbi:MAG: hypothetical protein PSX81_04200 [bacterium]|nr:hypothetical protein [bacterium]